ncbi:MAG: T9SS type A sorting domain-containing protein [bacterium]|nr:MAG: T9SS type A sorting domain-containing protein [bacterium]
MSKLSFTSIACMLLLAVVPVRAEWVLNGNVICNEANEQLGGLAVTDRCGGAIVTWADFRCCDWQIYIERIDSLGRRRFGDIPLCVAAGDQERPFIAPDGSGGAIVAWSDNRNGIDFDIYAQRIDSNGTAQWAENGIHICTAPSRRITLAMIDDGAGGAILAWKDARSDTAYHVFAQRVDGNGTLLWDINGVAVCTAPVASTNVFIPNPPAICPDGSGGAIITWDDYRSEGSNFDIYAQLVDSDGNIRWGPDGVPICTVQERQMNPSITSDLSGGAIITWHDWRLGYPATTDIYAQRVGSSGSPLWTADGVPVCLEDYHQEFPRIVSDGSGGGIITWYDNRTQVDADIYAQRIDSNGVPLWQHSGVIVCSAPDHQWYPKLCTDGDGGAVIAWTDYRTGQEYDIYAQKISRHGELLWTADGEPICRARYDQYSSAIVPDGQGGALITWRDKRTGTFFDIYAMRICEGVPPLETLLSGFESVLEKDAVIVRWTLTSTLEDMTFFVLRAEGAGGAFIELARIENPMRATSLVHRDEEVEAGTLYRYRVDMSADGDRIALFATDYISLPGLPLTLFQNHPNPFNPTTTISYYLPQRSHVRLAIFDAAGREIGSLVDAVQESGHYSVPWNGVDAHGRRTASGLYIYRLTAGKETRTRKMVLLK